MVRQSPWARAPASRPQSSTLTVRSSQKEQDCSHQCQPLSCMKRPGAGGAQEVRGAGTRGPHAASRDSAQAGKPAKVHRQPVNPTSRLTAPPRFWRACLSGFPQIIFGIFYFPLKHFRLASDGHNITPKYFVIPVLNDVVVPSLNSHPLEGK